MTTSHVRHSGRLGFKPWVGAQPIWPSEPRANQGQQPEPLLQRVFLQRWPYWPRASLPQRPARKWRLNGIAANDDCLRTGAVSVGPIRCALPCLSPKAWHHPELHASQ